MHCMQELALAHMDRALRRLHAGDVLVLDGALGESAASGVLHDTKRLLALGFLRSDSVYAEVGAQMIAEMSAGRSGSTAGRGASLMRMLYSSMPGLWDSYRLIAWLHAESSTYTGSALHRGTAALDAAINSLRSLLNDIGDAERQHSLPLSPAWAADGLLADPQVAPVPLRSMGMSERFEMCRLCVCRAGRLAQRVRLQWHEICTAHRRGRSRHAQGYCHLLPALPTGLGAWLRRAALCDSSARRLAGECLRLRVPRFRW